MFWRCRAVLPLWVSALLLSCLFSWGEAQNAPVSISVDASASRRAISPLIYGVAHATTAILTDLNCPLNRHGGNHTSRYNWQLNADNRGNDWYFQSIPYPSAVPGEVGDTFIASTRSAGAQPMLTIPMLDWVARLGPNRTKLCSFSIAKYGPQTDNDWRWFPDAGNGISALTGQFITGNDPNDANVRVDASFQQAWVNHLIQKWGTAANGGLRYYILDNEPSIWHSTHRDVHPVGATMQEVRDRIIEYASRIRQLDPHALIVAPEEWGWSGYFLSGYDQQWGSQHGWHYLPDRAAQGGWDYLPWLLDQLRQHHTRTGQRLLDIFSVHFYPQGGEFSENVSTTMQLRRNRSTRALWDPNYTDETWIATPVRLIPRLREWVDTYYPGTRIALTEYNWGAESHINGALAQADLFGIFGREGLDLATRWTTPDPSTPTYKAMKMYRNYDGNRSTFGDISVAATGPNPDNVAVYAAVRSTDNALTVMILCKYLSGNTPVTVNLSHFTHRGTAQVWQLTAANVIQRLSDISFNGHAFQLTVPAQSLTLLVLPSGNAAAPSINSTAAVKPATVEPGTSTMITATFINTGAPLVNGIIDLEIYNAAGQKVAQQFWTGQYLAMGQKRSFTYLWTAPQQTGVYTVRLGVFGAEWTPLYHWNHHAASIHVGNQDPAQYHFETGLQGWTHNGGIISSLLRTSERSYAGNYALVVHFKSRRAGQANAFVPLPPTPAGRTITFRIWFPPGSAITAIQPYVLQGAAGNWRWTGNWQSTASLRAGAWNTITVTVPPDAATPLYQLGVEFTTSAPWNGTCYIDSVGW